MEHPDNAYRLSGHYECFGKVGWNDLKSGFRGPNTIEFQDGGVIRFNTPDFKLGGTVRGERSMCVKGSIVYEDMKNNLRALVVMSTHKEAGYFFGKESGCKDEFVGQIYRSKENPMKPTEFSVK